jgi:ribosome-associated protein
MRQFKLNEQQDYIQLNDLLKVLDLVSTGGEAKIRIQEGEVKVNGATEWQVRKKLRIGDTVDFGEEKIVVN